MSWEIVEEKEVIHEDTEIEIFHGTLAERSPGGLAKQQEGGPLVEITPEKDYKPPGFEGRGPGPVTSELYSEMVRKFGVTGRLIPFSEIVEKIPNKAPRRIAFLCCRLWFYGYLRKYVGGRWGSNRHRVGNWFWVHYVILEKDL